jgi:outer membrane lipoprotein-sorting protein
MKGNNAIIFVMFVFTQLVFAQDYRQATVSQRTEIVRNISLASEQMKTLTCDFVQRKTISILSDELVSQGKLSFKQPNKLRWEYTTPYQYSFTMNADKILIDTGTSQNVLDVSNNNVMQEISNIIISGVDGSGIFDNNRFTTVINISQNDDYQVVLTPVRRDLRRMFNNITLIFDKTDYSVNSIEIREHTGDITFIVLKNKQINKQLDDKIFVIN